MSVHARRVPEGCYPQPWTGAPIIYCAKNEAEYAELGGRLEPFEPPNRSIFATVTAVYQLGAVDLKTRSGKTLALVHYDPCPDKKWGEETPGTWHWCKQ